MEASGCCFKAPDNYYCCNDWFPKSIVGCYIYSAAKCNLLTRRAEDMKLKSIKLLLSTGFFLALIISATGNGFAQDIPKALETITADDGSVWELVSEPGFGNNNNISSYTFIHIWAIQPCIYAFWLQKLYVVVHRSEFGGCRTDSLSLLDDLSLKPDI